MLPALAALTILCAAGVGNSQASELTSCFDGPRPAYLVALAKSGFTASDLKENSTRLREFLEGCKPAARDCLPDGFKAQCSS